MKIESVRVRKHLWCLFVFVAVLIGSIECVFAQSVRLSFPNEHIATLVMAEKFKEAEAELLKLETSSNPFLLAWLQLKQGKKQEGLALLEENISKLQESDRFSVIMSSIGVIGSAGFSEEAEQWKKKYAVDIESNDSLPAKQVQLSQFFQDKNAESAKKLIDQMLLASYKPDEIEMAKAVIFRYVMYLYTTEESLTEAIDYLDRLMQKFPETQVDPGYQMQKVNILTSMGNTMESFKMLDKIQTDYPKYYEENKAMFFLNRGTNYQNIGDHERAKQEYLKGQELCRASPKENEGLLMMFNGALQEYADKEQIIKAQEAARRAAMGEDYDLDEIIAQQPPRRYVRIVVVNVVLIAIIIVYFIWSRKRKP